jgi:hypothetical protein
MAGHSTRNATLSSALPTRAASRELEPPKPEQTFAALPRPCETVSRDLEQSQFADEVAMKPEHAAQVLHSHVKIL